MKIEGTELEYNEVDKVYLDYFLGGESETLEQWGKRVWDKCLEYHETKGLGNNYPNGEYKDKGMRKVYGRDAYDLWEEKKRSRRARFILDHTGIHCDSSILNLENIKNDLKMKKECEWPESHSDENVFKIKDDPKNNYKTACECFKEYEAKELEKSNTEKEKRLENISKLRNKFDDETIAIIYPKGANLL